MSKIREEKKVAEINTNTGTEVSEFGEEMKRMVEANYIYAEDNNNLKYDINELEEKLNKMNDERNNLAESNVKLET